MNSNNRSLKDQSKKNSIDFPDFRSNLINVRNLQEDNLLEIGNDLKALKFYRKLVMLKLI